MAVPKAILDQLAVVDADETSLETAVSTASGSQSALAAATEKAANDAHAVESAKAQISTDKQTLIDLINQTYSGVPSVVKPHA